MKIYALWNGSYEDRHIIGLYSKLEAAQRREHDGHEAEWSERAGRWDCVWGLDRKPDPLPASITLEQREVPVVAGVATLPNGSTVNVPPGQRLIVPIVPETAFSGIDWTGSCEYEIEEYDLLP